MSSFEEQLQKMKTHPGFIAALDQSGGSTPSALRAYGIPEGGWSSDEEMFAIVHQMRTRIIKSPAFDGDRIVGAILFENTMDRDIDGQPTADYLWNVKRVVPILKVDKGLAAEKDGAQLMKPMPALAALLDKAIRKRIFGTKARSFIKQANPAGILFSPPSPTGWEWGSPSAARSRSPTVAASGRWRTSPGEPCSSSRFRRPSPIPIQERESRRFRARRDPGGTRHPLARRLSGGL